MTARYSPRLAEIARLRASGSLAALMVAVRAEARR